MKKSPSLFFPLSLIAAGVIWLLVQMNIIPAENLWALAHVWPLILIALGIGLILRSIWHEGVGMAISALTVIAVVLAVFYAPQLNWAQAPETWVISGDLMGAVEGSGKIKSETRAVQNFDAIAIEYPAEILIVQGAKESVVIEADDNLLPQLSAKVNDGKLVIENSEHDYAKRVNPSQLVKITITVKNLRDVEFSTAGKLRIENLESPALEVELSGAGEIELIGLNVKSLECRLTGAGNIIAEGTAEQARIEIDGFGSFHGGNLQTDSADVTINGAGSADIKVKTTLRAEINGAGSVGYYGSPNVTKRIAGAGSVNDLDK